MVREVFESLEGRTVTQLPPPDGALFPNTDKPLQPCAPLGGYAPDTVRKLIAQARSDALEEAAAVCIGIALAPSNVILGVAITCRDAIMALKEKQE